MTKLAQWFSECVGPLIAAQYALDLQAARHAMAQAEVSLAAEADPSLRAVKDLRLRTAWFVALLELRQFLEAGPVFERLQGDFARPLTAEYAEVEALCEYMAWLHADVYGIAQTGPGMVHALRERIPPKLQTANYWDILANWAFRHHDTELLDESFGWFATHRTSELSEWVFMRLMLMKRLLAAKATEEDVCGLLRCLDHPGQVADAELLLWPVIEQHGLATPLTLALLEVNRDALPASSSTQAGGS